jgi:hypothetical protein
MDTGVCGGEMGDVMETGACAVWRGDGLGDVMETGVCGGEVGGAMDTGACGGRWAA